jgi:hypothetical protein
LAQRKPLFDRLKISADMDVVPMPGRSLCVTGTASEDVPSSVELP